VIVDMTGKRLTYNKESLLNSDFVTSCSESLVRDLMLVTAY